MNQRYGTLDRQTRSLSHQQAREVYDRIGRGQDTQRIYEDAAIDVLLQHAAFARAGSVVEFGCGTGRIARRLLREQLSATASYLGLEQSPRMVAIATPRLAAFGDRARIVQTDGRIAFPVADQSVDRVLSTYVFDLLSDSDIAIALAEAARVLVPGGRLCLVNLTFGRRPLERALTGLIERVHAFRPALLGGCRPVAVAHRLPLPHWQHSHHSIVRRFALTSEVLVATRL